MPYLSRTPKLLQYLHRGLTWRIPDDTQTVYLTFDDGPHPEITRWVLDHLESVGAKGTFFCVGANAERYPDIVAEIVARGHAVGNHTQHHVSGWKTDLEAYREEVATCAQHINSTLFRPPYGKITPAQIKALSPDYKIIMWDVLSADFDANITGEQCIENTIKSVRAGSIIVFHDSIKANPRLSVALPVVLRLLKEKGFQMSVINEG